jgi:hypothetical protein
MVKSRIAVQIDLSAALVAIENDSPRIMLLGDAARGAQQAGKLGLPSGPFDAANDRTLEEGLRRWVAEQSGIPLGYVEQLYTFGDRFRDPRERKGGGRPVSVGYLALVRQSDLRRPDGDVWSDWYRHFPWEDWRAGRPSILDAVLVPALRAWADADGERAERARRRERADTAFGVGSAGWDNERVLDRYELLYEAGLVAEAEADGRVVADDRRRLIFAITGQPMQNDHRRIVATAMGRLRGKVKYRPVIFELMPPIFTLFQLQQAIEALAGTRLHKQNFRRLVAHEGLVEPTGQVLSLTGGRPAELFRFRRTVIRERPAPGVRLPIPRATRMSRQ